MTEKLRERVRNTMGNLISLGNCNLAYKEGINSVGHEAMERAISPALTVYNSEYEQLKEERDRLSELVNAKNSLLQGIVANYGTYINDNEVKEIETAANAY